METGDAADQLVSGMHPDLLPPLIEFLEKDRRTRLAKRDAADVLRALFEPDELESLLVDAQQLDTSLWERVWNKAKRRPKGLTIMYALYLVDGYVEGSDEASYKAFVKAFAACKFPNHLVDDPERDGEGGWRIRVAGIGEGQDGPRLWHYFYMPDLGELTERQEEYLGASLIKAMQYAAEQTVGVRWGVDFRTLKRFGRNGDLYKRFGLGYEGVLMILAQSYTRGIVFFNMQLGDNRMRRFATLFFYRFKNAGDVEGGYPLKPGSYERETRFGMEVETDDEEDAPDLTDEAEEEAPLERDYEMKDELQIVETLIVATDDQVEYDVLVAVAEASVGLLFRFSVVDFLAELIKGAVARKEKPPFAVIDAQKVACARLATGLPPCETYKLLFSNDALCAALVSSGLVAPFETPEDGEIEAAFKSLRLAAKPPAFLEALRAVPVVVPDAAGVEVLAAVRRQESKLVGFVDRFLAALIRLRTKSGKVLELFEDATAVAAARRETGVQPYCFAFLLDKRGAEVRRLLSERSVPCEELVALADVDNEHDALLRAVLSPFYEALKRLNPSADLELADDVRVACRSIEGWSWTGDWGLEPFLVALLGSLENGSDELFASASRLAEARRACPDFLPCRLKALLDAEDDAGMTIRAALAGAGLKVDDLASWEAVKAASDVLDAKETALYQAAADMELVRDGTASTIVTVRGLVVGGLDDVRWASLDRILAAALPLAVKRRSDDAGLRLFDAQTLADALVDSEEAYILYRFLKLLEEGDGVADDVRLKLAAVDLDEGGYPAATEAQVKPALKTARDAVRAAEKKRKAETKQSPRRIRRGPLSGN